MAGRDVTEELQRLLRKSGSVFHTSAEKEIVKQIKEKVSYVALDPKKEEKEWMNASSRGGESKIVEYVLPDGKKLKVGPERFRAAEILFEPELIGLEWPGLHQIVVDSINRTDMDLRKALFGNIVLSGGSTMIKGFGDRLLHEVQRLAVKDMRIKIFAPPERLYSTWIGGSILAGLSTFRKMYVTIDDWHESKSRFFDLDRHRVPLANRTQTRTLSIKSSLETAYDTPSDSSDCFIHSPALHGPCSPRSRRQTTDSTRSFRQGRPLHLLLTTRSISPVVTLHRYFVFSSD